MPLYIAKVEIWTGATNAWQTDSQLKDSATQPPTKHKSEALAPQYVASNGRNNFKSDNSTWLMILNE